MLWLIAAITTITVSQAPTAPKAASLERQLHAEIAKSKAEVAVAVRSFDGTLEVLIDADKQFHAASTMKVPVMIELFRQAHAGMLKLDEPLTIRNEFKSIVDGSPYKLGEGDDSDKAMYDAIGKKMTLRQLCDAMITVSSNFATNLLIDRLGVENIRSTVTRLGADGMQVLRGVEDQKAFEKGLNNSTTARGLMVLFEKIAAGTAVTSEADREMIGILKRQKFNDAIPSGLPKNIPVAHKTGNITRIHHDAGIVYAGRPYVVVLLVRGIQSQKESGALMARLSRLIYKSAQSAGKN